jgi:FkbM family methyltransferase
MRARLAHFRQTVLKSLLASRPGRRLLAIATTVYARRRTGARVKVFFDSVWGHEVDGVRVPDSRRFCYYGEAIDRWIGEPAKWLRMGREFWCVTYQPKPGDTIIDVGAGMGSDAFFFSSVVGNTGKVLAIEANPHTFVLLVKLCEWNNLRNVDCRSFAIVDCPKQVVIEDADCHEANALAAGPSAAGAVVPVQGVRLDDLVATAGLTRIDFIKMNIEGAETLALEGMKDSLKRTRHVCIACHDFRAERGEGEYFRTRAQVEKVLGELGFQVLPIDPTKGPATKDHVHAFRDA